MYIYIYYIDIGGPISTLFLRPTLFLGPGWAQGRVGPGPGWTWTLAEWDPSRAGWDPDPGRLGPGTPAGWDPDLGLVTPGPGWIRTQ